MKNVMKRLVRVGCMAVAVFCIAACDSDLDIQQGYAQIQQESLESQRPLSAADG